jgi:HSP20 family protein
MNDLIKPFDLFDDFHRPMSSWLGREFPFRFGADSDVWMPPVDIRQGDNEYVIEIEVPGFQPDDVDVEVHEGVLTIKGERSSESESNEEGVIRRERRRGRFIRRFSLPNSAPTDEIDANVKDGVLTVTVPQAVPASTTKIDVT